MPKRVPNENEILPPRNIGRGYVTVFQVRYHLGAHAGVGDRRPTYETVRPMLRYRENGGARRTCVCGAFKCARKP